MEYVFIGSEELVTAFRLVGIPGIAVDDRADSAAAFTLATTGRGPSIASFPTSEAPRPRVLIITEEVADHLGDSLTAWQLSGNYPLIVEIPGLQGHLEGRKTLVDAIRDAIGIQV